MKPGKHAVSDKTLLDLASCLRLHSSLICKHRNFIIISALFKKAFCKCQIYKPLTIFSKYKFHNLANASCKLPVTLAPLTEILAAVHLRCLVAGNGKLLYFYFFIQKKQICIFQDFYHMVTATMRKSDIQIQDLSFRRTPFTSGMFFCIFLKLPVPAFALFGI